MPGNGDVVRRVGEDDRRPLARQERGVAALVESVATEQAVAAEQPEVAGPAHGETGEEGEGSVGRIRLALKRAVQALDAQIDLAHIEADRLELEVEFGEGEVAQRFGQQALVPGRGLG